MSASAETLNNILRMRHRAQQRLAPHDDEFVLIGDVRTGPDDVFEVFAVHGSSLLTGGVRFTPFFRSETLFKMD